MVIPGDETLDGVAPGGRRRVKFIMYKNAKLFNSAADPDSSLQPGVVLSVSFGDMGSVQLQKPLHFTIPNVQVRTLFNRVALLACLHMHCDTSVHSIVLYSSPGDNRDVFTGMKQARNFIAIHTGIYKMIQSH